MAIAIVDPEDAPNFNDREGRELEEYVKIKVK